MGDSERSFVDVSGMDMLKTAPERILIVDDEQMILNVTATALRMLEYDITTATNVEEGKSLLNEYPFDLVLTDIRMPYETGVDLLRYCKDKSINVPFIMMSGFADSELIIEALNLGARFFLSKPFPIETLEHQVDSVLSSRRYEQLHKKMLEYLKHSKQTLERKVHERTIQLEKTQDAIAMVLSGMAETRDPETGEHLVRTKAYAECLGRGLLEKGYYVDQLKGDNLGLICRSTILHDIGKVGVPDEILLKPGKLTAEEFEIMKKHTVYGASTFDRAIEFCGADSFLLMSRDIARSHHERWDGAGYPDALAGEDIPLAARIMSVADVYDALISKRCYKEAFEVNRAEEVLLGGAGTQFDPTLIEVFAEKKEQFAKIAQENEDRPEHEG